MDSIKLGEEKIFRANILRREIQEIEKQVIECSERIELIK